MTKRRTTGRTFSKYLGTAVLTSAVALGGATSAFAQDDDDDDDDDSSGNPTVVNTGGEFDNDALPLTLAASGMMVVAGGALAVRRRTSA